MYFHNTHNHFQNPSIPQQANTKSVVNNNDQTNPKLKHCDHEHKWEVRGSGEEGLTKRSVFVPCETHSSTDCINRAISCRRHMQTRMDVVDRRIVTRRLRLRLRPLQSPGATDSLPRPRTTTQLTYTVMRTGTIWPQDNLLFECKSACVIYIRLKNRFSRLTKSSGSGLKCRNMSWTFNIYKVLVCPREIQPPREH